MIEGEILLGVFPHQRYEIYDKVEQERLRQDDLWGEQSWPNGTTGDYADIADAYKDACDQATRAGALTWHDILFEEFFEAMAEEDPEALMTELIQVIAVATAWVEDIRRKLNG